MSRSSDRQPKPYGADVVREMISFRTHLADNIIKPVSEPPIVCPTTALLQIKNKKEAGRCITQDEWARLTHFVFLGAEYPSARSISRESVIGILQAFKDAYAVNHHVGDNTHFASRADNSAVPSSYNVPTALDAFLSNTTKGSTGFGARFLHVFLRDEVITDSAELTQALLPYWDILWRVAARGHYRLLKKPLRKESKVCNAEPLPLATLSNKSWTLSFMGLDSGDVNASLGFPVPMSGTAYPLHGYTQIGDFRAMLSAIAGFCERGELSEWKGDHFFAYMAHGDGPAGSGACFGAIQNGIKFGFTFEQWNVLSALFAEAWEISAMQSVWTRLMEEYGEQ